MNSWEKELCKCPNCGGNNFHGNSYEDGEIEHERLCWDCGYIRYYEKVECLCPKDYYLDRMSIFIEDEYYDPIEEGIPDKDWKHYEKISKSLPDEFPTSMGNKDYLKWKSTFFSIDK